MSKELKELLSVHAAVVADNERLRRALTAIRHHTRPGAQHTPPETQEVYEVATAALDTPKSKPLVPKEVTHALSEAYGEIIRPIKEYCAALELWRAALSDLAYRKRLELFPGMDGAFKDPRTQEAWEKYRNDMKEAKAAQSRPADPGRYFALENLRNLEEISQQADDVFRNIRKSSLLYRILYNGESMRMEMCPEHKGTWDGQAMLQGCKFNCHGTGWLPDAPVSKSVTPLMLATMTRNADGEQVLTDVRPPAGSVDPPVGEPGKGN